MKLSDNAKAALETVIEKFKEGDLSPIVTVARLHMKSTDNLPFAKWSLANKVIAFTSSHGQVDSRGFKQWEEVKRRVKKGGKAVFIFAPNTRKIEEGGESRYIVTGFRTIPVFPLSETDGEPMPEFDYSPADMPPLAEVAERMGVSVTYAPLLDSASGFYSPGRDSIVLGTHDVQIFFHELAHAAHNRIEGGLKGAQAEEQETVAEFSAAVLASLYGYDYTGNAWKYISHYNSDPITAIYKALSTVEKVLSVITGEAIDD